MPGLRRQLFGLFCRTRNLFTGLELSEQYFSEERRSELNPVASNHAAFIKSDEISSKTISVSSAECTITKTFSKNDRTRKRRMIQDLAADVNFPRRREGSDEVVFPSNERGVSKRYIKEANVSYKKTFRTELRDLLARKLLKKSNIYDAYWAFTSSAISRSGKIQ